jgi:hypothetical protein
VTKEDGKKKEKEEDEEAENTLSVCVAKERSDTLQAKHSEKDVERQIYA